MAQIIKELERHPDQFKSLVCVTAQHRQMLTQVLDLFDIQPDYDLDIMIPGQNLFDVTSNVLKGIKPVLEKERPDFVLVQGDTTTTLAAALASFYLHIPVGHIEAGLRTGNMLEPFPEEMNRKVSGVLADIHFAPTPWARDNLLREGVPPERIFVTGNTGIDALLMSVEKIQAEQELRSSLERQFDFLNPNKRMVLVTCHRRENFGPKLESICQGLRMLASQNQDIELVYPVHPNPNIREPVNRILGDGNSKNIFLIEPLEYLPFIYLMQRSVLILTDSGGIQEESLSLGKPVLVMRDTTERVEALQTGWIKLVGTDSDRILLESEAALRGTEILSAKGLQQNMYGDGHSSELIISHVLDYLKTEHCL